MAVANRSAEDEVLCRGLGPRIWGMHKRVPDSPFTYSPPQAALEKNLN